MPGSLVGDVLARARQEAPPLASDHNASGHNASDHNASGHDASDHDASDHGRRRPGLVRRLVGADVVGGAVLLAAAISALAWANSPWQAPYRELWSSVVTVGIGRLAIAHDLRHWVNEGLMAAFFFAVGLEIKRELVIGELREPRIAALPVLAALGGMVVPAVVFLAVTAGGTGSAGWGVPMATDIVFALAVVAIVGSRVPVAVKLFVLTLAVVDDVGAIAVTAAFYTRDVRVAYLAVAAAIVALIVVLLRRRVGWLPLYLALGVGLWLAVLGSGVHPTIAGVVLGLLVPARRARRLEDLVQPWTTFLVVPVFALANAGVSVHTGAFAAPGAAAVAAGAGLGLVVGKAVGITGATWVAVRAGVGRLPEGVGWATVASIAAIGGMGFTISLFIAELAFGSTALLDAAKLGVLGATAVSGVVGGLALTRACRP